MTEDVNSAPRGCTNLRLRRLGRAVARQYEAELRRLGLRDTQYALLSHVVLQGPLSQAELARRLGLQPSTLTRNLQPLLAQGWVVVQAGPDARSHLVRATPAGREWRAQAQRAWKRAQVGLNERLGAERVARLHALLDECSALLGAAEGA